MFKAPNKARTPVACRITGINPDRLNEWISAGEYNCAPKTIAGRARVFSVRDMVALWIFRELMSSGLAASAASGLACSAVDCLPESGPFPDTVYKSGPHWFECGFREVAAKIAVTPFDIGFVFKVGSIAKTIERLLAEEAMILGDDD